MNNRFLQSDGDTIRKVFHDRIAYDSERRIYALLEGTGLIPALLDAGEDRLMIERKAGSTLSEVLYRTGGGPGARSAVTADAAETAVLAAALAGWMEQFQAAFHAKTGGWMVNEDLNPRNLLVTGEPPRICGIDFESWHFGEREEAFAVLPAMLEAMDLEEDVRSILTGTVRSRFAGFLDRERLDRCVEEGLAGIRLRRSAMQAIRTSSCGIMDGGKGSRMGGADKGSLMLESYRFMEHILHTVQCFDRILISTAGLACGFGSGPVSDAAYPHVPDLHPGKGPMGALEALLTACETDTLLILPCDTPLISRETIYRLFGLYSQPDGSCDAAVLRCRGRLCPTIGIYSKRILPQVQRSIADGSLRMTSLLEQIAVRYLDTENESEIQNINTPEDLERLRRTYSSRRISTSSCHLPERA